jgi:DNA-binding transcriptional LysR family regulator
MELRQLEYFVAVAEEANFTRAAERVHISQSGVSAQIRQLERDLGATLFDRSGRTASLTIAGDAALGCARAVLAAADAVRRAVDDVTGLIRGRLVVGMLNGSAVTGLFDSLATFHRAHPEVELTLIEDTSEPLTEQVRAGTADIALVATAGPPPWGFSALQISSEQLVAAVPFDHPLAGRRRVTLAELAAFPIVAMPEGTVIRMVFDRACAEAGLAPDITLHASAPDAVAHLAARGLGVAILPESLAAQHAARLHSLTIRELRTPAGLALIWSATTNPALTELVRHAEHAFAAPGTP